LIKGPGVETTDILLELSASFAELGSELRSAGDSAAALHRIVEFAVEYVEGCRCASIVSIRGKQTVELAVSDELAGQLDQLQTALDEGPGLDAARLDTSYIVHDLGQDQRWPRFARGAVHASGIRSTLAFTLGSAQSSLTMHSEQPTGFSDEAIGTATIFASHAASLVALFAAEDHSTNLETALQSSREIGIALGILMAHRKVTQDAAFDLLRSASQNLHRKLRDVAGEVLETGTLPDLPSK
jgi:hypothetical protein